ncbi:MAG: hypothetical protein NT020_06120 [Chloroflexales bacterium]|nr:hypothetical protein [Chloroflexales bacterium]
MRANGRVDANASLQCLYSDGKKDDGNIIRIIAEGNGKWKMENGKWKMENGKWKMENGKWKMEGFLQKNTVVTQQAVLQR